MPVRITATSGTSSWTLGSEPVLLPASLLILSIQGHAGFDVLLDGRSVRWPRSADPALVSVDLARSTGYHRLQVGQQTWWFSTQDAKLGLAGVEEMLRWLRNGGTGWTGQLLFSDGAVLRDPHVVYSWLDQWADRSIDAVARVLQAPRAVSRSDLALSRRGGRAVHPAATLRLLRGHPDRYLEASPTGLLAVDDQRYNPLRVVVRHRTSTVESPANRRAALLMSSLVVLAREVIDAAPDAHVAARCRAWIERADNLRRRPLARTLVAGAPPGTELLPRQTEEAIDRRYQATYAVSRDLAGLFGWSVNRTILPRFSYVQRSDTIYQAFVATALGAALGLTPTSNVLGQTSPAFTGPEYDLYYDTPAASAVLRSWRFHSSRPDESRPDVLLQRRSTGEVLIMDAKYRQDGTNATESSRKDVSAYMGLYGLDHVIIAYPAVVPAMPVAISGMGQTITELPVSPTLALVDELVTALPQLLAAMQTPPY